MKPPPPAKESSVHPTFGAKLRWFRMVAGLTQQELADSVGKTRPWIGHIEGGTENVSYPTAVSLAGSLRIPVAWLWDHSPAPLFDPPTHQPRNRARAGS